MPNVGEIVWGDGAPYGGGGGEPPAALPTDAAPCAERRTRKMLDALSSVFDKTYGGRGAQHPILYAVATAMCAWAAEFEGTKLETFVATAAGRYLDVCGANYGVGRPNISITDAQYRDLIRLCAFTPKGTIDIVRRFVQIVTGLTPTITEPGGYVVRIAVPSEQSTQEGFALGFYPSASESDTDAAGGAGRGRGYAGDDLALANRTGQSYAFGQVLGSEALDILNKLVMAGVKVEVVTT